MSQTRQDFPGASGPQARMTSPHMQIDTQSSANQEQANALLNPLTNYQTDHSDQEMLYISSNTDESTQDCTAQSKIIRTTTHNKRPLEGRTNEETTSKRNKQHDKKQTSSDLNNNDSLDDSVFYESEQNVSGIISDDCTVQTNAKNTEPPKNKTYTPTTAKVDLNANLANLPQTALQVFIHNATDNKKLATINPYKIKAEIDTLCGPVNNVEHRRNGTLLITAKTADQVQTLVKATRLPISQIPIKGSVAWSTQTVSGKIYAPEFAEDTLADLLELLKPVGVIAIRKFLQDPNKKHVPIYVLTFLNNKCPEKIQVGYTSYRVDEYYSQPLRCTNCCRWGHSQRNCHGSLTCGQCGQQGHHQKNCSSNTTCCPNCKEDHPVNSKKCKKFIEQQNLCKIKSTLNISYQEARKKMNETQINRSQNTTPQTLNNNTQIPPDTQSEEIFPRYSNYHPRHQKQTRNSPTQQAYHPTTQTTNTTQLTLRQQTQANLTATVDSETPLLLDLPPLSPQYCLPAANPNNSIETSTTNLHANNSHTQNHRSYANTTKNHPTQNSNIENPGNQGHDFRDIIIKLLPLLIKLILSNKTTDKIECFIEMGTVLQAENIITEALANLGTTSISPTI